MLSPLVLLLAPLASAADLPWQGRLLDATGTPLNGSHDVRLALWDAPTDGVEQYALALDDVTIDAGYLAATLQPADSLVTGELFLQVSVDGSALGPRQPLARVPRAASAEHVSGWVDLSVSDDFGEACTVEGRMGFERGTQSLIVCGSTGQWLRFSATGPTGRTAADAATSCLAIHEAHPALDSGVYWLDVDGGGSAPTFRTWCDMDRDGGGWTLVMQNNGGVATSSFPNLAASTSAVTTWGSLEGAQSGFDILVGLSMWSSLGTEGRYEVGSSAGSRSKAARFPSFQVTGSTYVLTISGYEQLAGSGSPGIYAHHNGYGWTTYDADRDTSSGNCSHSYNNAPWWYESCWSGNIWGNGGASGGYTPNAYWTGSSGDYWAWGALWLR